jgi:GNAT superfamily N-acetyltransferase
MISTIRLSDKHHAQINALWDEEYPTTLVGRFPILFDNALLFKHFIILNEEENIMAWAVYFQKDEEIRFSILVDRNHQGKGLGKQLIDAIKSELPEFSGWVIDKPHFMRKDGTAYPSPLSFYLKLGFEILPDQRIDNDMINAVKVRFSRSANRN